MFVQRNNNTIEIKNLTHRNTVGEFIIQIHNGKQAGFHEFFVDLSAVKTIFPNASVPIAGLIDFYNKNGYTIQELGENLAVRATHLFDPIQIESESDLQSINPLNKTFRYNDSKQVFWLVNAMLEELQQSDKFEQGVMQGLEWCLNEVMDNVIHHSDSEYGFVMGQIHKSRKHVAFTVFDTGRGIYNSLKNSEYKPRSPLDALTISVQEGVTRDKKIGQGNGMYGLSKIIENNQGSLNLTSYSASLLIKGNEIKKHEHIPYLSKDNACVIVDFQIDYGREVSIADALKFNGKSYEPVNMKIEELENEKGEIEFNLHAHATGFGTRQSGERVRNQILNLHQQSNQVIVFDFQGINLISSSFADEFLGKLVVEFGFFGFNNLFRLRNMNSLVQNIVQRSVSQRMAESIE